MRSRLNLINGWENLAEVANYSTNNLAKSCGSSARQLERFFLETRGMSPCQWLTGLRQRTALQLIGDGLSVKEVATKLAYQHASHFSRAFKKFHGLSPMGIRITTPTCRV